MQIIQIVIYSHDGRKRDITFELGKVNIIPGASKSGKSALIEIIDYIFGSGQCGIPEGPIRRCVSWFGVLLQLGEGQAFIARRCPDKNKSSSEDCFVDIGNIVSAPSFKQLHQTTNKKGLESLLASWVGINDNLHEPPEGQTRLPLEATIRHALAFCFQPQDEIIRRKQLFHGSNDNFFAQAMKDTLPYFLGAVDDDYVRKSEELRGLKEQLRVIDRQMAELKSIRGNGISKASTILTEARNVGLTNQLPTNWDETIEALKLVSQQTIEQIPDSAQVGEEYSRLSIERDTLQLVQRRLKEEIASVQSFEESINSFTVEAIEQRTRLSSIGIFEGKDPNHSCPLCSQELPDTTLNPSVEEIKNELSEVSVRLDSISRSSPRVQKAISELNSRLKNIESELNRNRTEMEAISKSNEQLRQLRDEATRRAMIIGRVSLYLESIPNLPDTKNLEEKAKALHLQIQKLNLELSHDNVRERVDSINSILGQRMTEWARRLDLEHSIDPLRFNFNKLTIIADTVNGPIPMDRMGSGENWVGYHLIAHLALHEWFTKKERPLPRFLFLDQPSQVYFPPEKEVDGTFPSVGEDDRKAVSRMFQFIFDVVKGLFPDFQVIITEHADLADDWYQAAVVERWRNGLKFVPEDWPREN